MKRAERAPGELKYTFDYRHAPVVEVEPGESFIIETEDAPSGIYRSVDDASHLLDAWYLNYSPPKANPLTGPVYVRGAQPGDTLVVNLERIEVDAQSVVYWRPGGRPMGDSIKWSELSKPTLAIGQSDGGKVALDWAATFEDGQLKKHPLHLNLRQSPFIGTLGVAPEREVETSVLGQGSWGGNMDVRDVCAGSRVLLPCYHEGALFYAGDVHACQGDTEFIGTAMETRGTLTLSCDLIKGRNVPFVRIENASSLISLACARPLEEAVSRATIQLMEWLVQEYGCSQREVYLLVGVNPDFRINVYQMAAIDKLRYTAGAEIFRRCLPDRVET
jgi:amidase